MPASKKRELKAQQAQHLAPSLTVRSDARVSNESSFGNVQWLMDSVSRETSLGRNFDFSTIPGFPAGFALGAAEYAYHRLYKPIVSHDRAGAWPTVYNELGCVRQFASHCSNFGCDSFADVDLDVFMEFYHAIKSENLDTGKSEGRQHELLSVIYRLWEYSSSLTQPLGTIPFGEPKEKILTAQKSNPYENKTPVIPVNVYTSLTKAALDYVLIYSESILRIFRELRLAWTEIDSLELSESGKWKRLARAAEELTRTIASPWRKRSWNCQDDIYQELHQLRSAATIVIFAFSGIRVSELISLESGCCVLDILEDGRRRHYINSTVRKHRGMSGSRDTWVVIEEVVTAIEILEELTQELRTSSNSKRLFLSTGSNAPFSITSGSGSADQVSRSSSLIYSINRFLELCNLQLDRAPIPHAVKDDGSTCAWHVTPRQFRRTLARFIAREPFGIIAGMLQYKHVSVSCFEGYAGEDPEWNKMLEDEAILSGINILDEVAMDLAAGAVSGQVAITLQEQFLAEFLGRAEDFPPSQIAKWLANTKRDIYVGKFNFCFFKEESALCTAGMERKSVPIVNACDPGRCSNACVTKKHAPLWMAHRDQAAQMLNHPKASPFQRIALQGQIDAIDVVLKPLGRPNER